MANYNNSKDLLFSASAAFILGLNSDLKVRGSSEKVIMYREALHASRVLFKSLNDRSSTLEEVVNLIHKKRAATEKFRKCLGFSWLL